jgi:hypothetical protein
MPCAALTAFNLCMNGNNIDDHLRHGIVIENTYGSVCSGNMIEECNGTAIILDRDCYGITLSANVIAHHLEGGIDLRDATGCARSARTPSPSRISSPSASARTPVATPSLEMHFAIPPSVQVEDKRPAEAKNRMGIDEGTGVLLEGCRGTCRSRAIPSPASPPQPSGPRQRVEGLLVTANLCADCAVASWKTQRSPGSPSRRTPKA